MPMIQKKSSTNLMLPSVAKSTTVVVEKVEEEEAVEEAEEEVVVEAVVEEVQDLLPNLSQWGRAKLLFQLQQMLEPWARNQQSLQAIAPKRMTSLKKLKHISVSTKMLPGLILQSKRLPLPSPLLREIKSLDGSKTWAPGLMDLIMSIKTSLSYGLNSLMNLKLNSKISTNNNEPEWHLTSAKCNGPTSPSIYDFEKYAR